MRTLSSTLCAMLALSFAAGTAVPASAAPVFAPRAQAETGNAIDVQYRVERRDDRRLDNRSDRRDRFERRGNTAYYNGHRGYQQRRPGYRQHNGFWFPAGAFIAGAIIGGALNNNQPMMRMSSQHVRWCQNRWRSYRASDNSYQPSYGPRQRCVSPYS
ncbi:MAG: BA14K family protein [Mesorhizobium sp.]|nr:BA14K family protein [Mesorhizobium sp.]